MATIIPFARNRELHSTRAFVDRFLEDAGDALLRFDELSFAVTDGKDARALMKHLLIHFPGPRA